MTIRRVRLKEPLGAFLNHKLVIVPAGREGVVADRWPDEPEDSFAVIIDEPGYDLDYARCPEVVEVQVEDVEP